MPVHRHWLRRALSVLNVTGPILGKELRVASRRQRNYWLRFGYLLGLTAFIFLIWMGRIGLSVDIRDTQRMSLAGRTTAYVLIWFQFIVCQLVAVVLTSDAVSSEITAGTLGTLLTSPINSLQVVVGKLLSKLWQLGMLIAISIPLLLLVRVFGGVPWDFVLAGVCITATASLFAASVSMLYSAVLRKAYASILLTLITGGVLYLLVPLLGLGLLDGLLVGRRKAAETILAYPNPIGALVFAGDRRYHPTFHWPVHCWTMLVGSGLLLLVTVLLVRRVGRKQFGNSVRGSRRAYRRARRAAAGTAGPSGDTTPGQTGRPQAGALIRRVIGPAVLWRELRQPLFRSRRLTIVVWTCLIGLLLLSYLVLALEKEFRDDAWQVMYVVVMLAGALLTTAVIAATPVSSEKEARTLPALLATPLSDAHIVFAKFVGALRRVLPVWALLPGHVTLLVLLGYMEEIAPLMLLPTIFGPACFLAASGVLFSSHCRKTTAAVICNLLLALLAWLVVPLVLALTLHALNAGHDMEEALLGSVGNVNPIVQLCVCTEANLTDTYLYNHGRLPAGSTDFDWPTGRRGLGRTLAILAASCAAYTAVSAGLLGLAVLRLRRRLF